MPHIPNLRNSPEYRLKRAGDRGHADAYYWRNENPHIWLDALGLEVVPKEEMTEAEIREYMREYEATDYRKDFF